MEGRAETEDAARTFRLLSYNVNALPRGLSFPRRRLPTIGRLANSYDVIATQEVWGGASLLAREMPNKQAVPGGGLDGDPRKLLLKALLLPFTFFLPDFWPPFGSGLYTFIDRRLLGEGGVCAPSDIARQPYRDCYGVLAYGTDWFVRKGFLRIAFDAGGIAVDVYNTHLDAGNDEGSRDARWTQLRELACAIDAVSSGRPTIVAGDFNNSYSRRGDRQPMEAFREHLGLADSGAGPEAPYWRERDYIFYRDGDRARLIVERSGEDHAFVPDRRALSDHPAVFAVFHVEPEPSGRRDTPLPERRFNCARSSANEST
jgi:endonuclease/exonuclease/phosphatase family metal-dependent hydrolase